MKHTRDAIVHTHEHAHIVHYLRHGTQWEHMAATHSHEHNHQPWSTIMNLTSTPRQSTRGKPTTTTTVQLSR